LRIGYLSPDFCHHAVAYFFEPVLAAHDRARVEIFCYANVLTPDVVTQRLRALAEHWRDIAPLSDEQATQVIRADRLDLLVDMAGHTARHRLLVFARRAAPHQLTWLGYPNTTGLTTMDYRLTDSISDPLGTTDSLHTERLVRMPGPFSVYQPPDDAPPVGFLPALALNAPITFGCFNNFAKITPEIIALWCRLLLVVPSARLMLKSRGLGDVDTARRIHELFAAGGVSPERVVLDGRELSVSAHLALYHQVDVALDAFPYNGATTTCEALWMGVPVVTLAGATHVSRVGASLLTHLGAQDWIATTSDDYLAIARRLVADLLALSRIRAGLRERMRVSALCDAVGFTRALETTYAGLIE
jgi:protein O-GlcNAc transferase